MYDSKYVFKQIESYLKKIVSQINSYKTRMIRH